MKILHYNFVQPGGFDTGAGGVGIYLHSLVNELSARGHEVFCLSSGNTYSGDLEKVELTKWTVPDHVALDVVNSPILGPFYLNFYSLQAYLNSTGLDHLPGLIREKVGELDVIHIHNNEGLTIRFFYMLKKAFPSALFLMSAHNYTLVCPQVNLWQHDVRRCLDYQGGRACVSCIAFQDAHYEKKVKAHSTYLHKTGLKTISLFKPKHDFPPLETDHWRRAEWQGREILTTGISATYQDYRTAHAAMVKAVFDRILAVSHRTKKVLTARGIPSQSIAVSYIGSRHVGVPNVRQRMDYVQKLNVAYIGYPRRDKGFDFFLETMERASEDIAININLHIVVSIEDGSLIQRVGRLAQRFADVRLVNGYSSEDLPDILNVVDLGVVPPLWEDNLPQVAIEYVAYGVPILVSDLGGAAEIARKSDFIFTGGCHASLLSTLQKIVNRETLLAEFWNGELNIRTPSDHVDELLAIYSRQSDGNSVPR